MELNEYQKKARATAIYPNLGNNLIYPLLGLIGETVEAFEKPLDVLEWGDVCWYVSNLATELKIPLEEVASLLLEDLYYVKK